MKQSSAAGHNTRVGHLESVLSGIWVKKVTTEIMRYLSLLSAQSPIDVEQLRARLREMSDKELMRFGRAAVSMCSPRANVGKTPREVFVQQLEEARAEVKRRKAAKESKRDFGL